MKSIKILLLIVLLCGSNFALGWLAATHKPNQPAISLQDYIRSLPDSHIKANLLCVSATERIGESMELGEILSQYSIQKIKQINSLRQGSNNNHDRPTRHLD